ncbi:MAG TPA: 50S ribosomal protein L3 [Candidatus Kapabacteria bacterium]|jgi:large subunit ribosomal protein L3|nr:50S ribosomal protein L3 [Candidatus Kapabacteria bacterium]HOV92156.1 50S ribosomal protein L3 [Candidatus Kapabacteria bacterium]
MKAAILGRKIGMTTIYNESGRQIPVTLVKAGPCPILKLRTEQEDGYNAVMLGFEEIEDKKLNKPISGLFKKLQMPALRYIKEFRDLTGDYAVGKTITVENFNIGSKVKITGISKGKGYQGVVKRHHFGGVGMVTHGQSDRQRHPGSIGASSYPSRVIKGLRMAGQMGNKQVSVKNLEVVGIYPEENVLAIKGGVPGTKNSLIEIVEK